MMMLLRAALLLGAICAAAAHTHGLFDDNLEISNENERLIGYDLLGDKAWKDLRKKEKKEVSNEDDAEIQVEQEKGGPYSNLINGIFDDNETGASQIEIFDENETISVTASGKKSKTSKTRRPTPKPFRKPHNDTPKSKSSKSTSKQTPTPKPTSKPTAAPATKKPTAAPTTKKLTGAREKPTAAPTTKKPTAAPTTKTPTAAPTTKKPTAAPTTKKPTAAPTTKTPTAAPTTKKPTAAPTTKKPTAAPTTKKPTAAPTTKTPTAPPVTSPPNQPTPPATFPPATSPPGQSNAPAKTLATAAPTTKKPTTGPTKKPTTGTPSPTKKPTTGGTTGPTKKPTTGTPSPTKMPTAAPTTIDNTYSPTTSSPTITAKPTDSWDEVETIDYGITMVKSLEMIAAAKADGKTPSLRTICIIDDGYDLGHPDLPTDSDGVTGADNNVISWNEPIKGHGTLVAGIIGAIGNNTKGVMGVMPDPKTFKFHIIHKAMGVAEGIENCMENGANVINISLGGSKKKPRVEAAAKDAYDEGVLLVASAGNCGEEDRYSYPSSYPHVMSVIAVDVNRGLYKTEKIPTKSLKGCTEPVPQGNNVNDQVEISAPGVHVWSTMLRSKNPEGYARKTGTSFASPHVAGVAALVWSYFPNCTNFQIRTALISSASKQGDPGCDKENGHGIVNAKAAYDLLKFGDCGNIPKKEETDAVGGCKQYTVPFNKTADYSNLGPYVYVDHNQFDEDDDEYDDEFE